MWNIFILCIASLLLYLSKEIIYPILPLYLTTILGITPQFVGLIEGITKAITSIVKFYSGYFSDKTDNRKRYVIIGFLCTFIYKIILILSTSWFGITSAKSIDRLGKGIRTAPKDAIIAENSRSNKRGLAFGILRLFEKVGAVIGILISYFLITKMVLNYKKIFLIAAIPSALAVITLFFLKQNKDRAVPIIDFNKFSKNIKLFFIIAFISSLGNSTKSFLLLKASDSGISAGNIILLYLIANITTCILSYPFGRLCDNISKRKIVIMAYLIFSLTYLGFALSTNRIIITLLFIGYGVFIALISIGAKSFIIENAPIDMKGSALGMNEFLIGIATLPATIIAGALWTLNSNYSFYFSSIVGFIATLLVIFKIKET